MTRLLDSASISSGRKSPGRPKAVRWEGPGTFDYQPSIPEKNKARFRLPNHLTTDLPRDHQASHLHSQDHSSASPSDSKLLHAVGTSRQRSKHNSSHSSKSRKREGTRVDYKPSVDFAPLVMEQVSMSDAKVREAEV